MQGRRSRRRGRAAVVPLAVLASGAMVFQASNAAFTATTSTGTNSFTAGSVYLNNTASGGALLSAGTMRPGTGNGGSACVTVSYTGSLANPGIRFYLKDYSNPAPGQNLHNLGAYLRVTLEESGAVTSDAACSGFTSTGTYLNPGGSTGDALGTFAAGAADWTSGRGSWAPPAGSSTSQQKSWKVTYWLPDVGETGMPDQATLNDLQGSSTQATLTWEARSS